MSCRSSCAALAVRNRATERIDARLALVQISKRNTAVVGKRAIVERHGPKRVAGITANGSPSNSRSLSNTSSSEISRGTSSLVAKLSSCVNGPLLRPSRNTAKSSNWTFSLAFNSEYARSPCYPADAGSATDSNMAAGRTDVPQFALGL